MTEWPETLPQRPLADGYTEDAPDALIRSRNDQGPEKIRRRTSAAPRNMRMVYLLSAEQTAALDAFYLETLKGGSLQFSAPHPRNGTEVAMRFLAPPSYESAGGAYFRAALQLEILP